jgi:pimeloyl-ACP methyl ester carboxylesterase
MVDPDRQAEYDAYIHSHADRPWFDLLHGLLKLDTPLTAGPIEQWRQIKDVDSSTLWPRIDCPVMQAFGEADVLVDTELSVGRMQQMIDATGKTNFTIHVYPAPVGHSVGYENEAYWDDLRAWWETVQSDWAVQDE